MREVLLPSWELGTLMPASDLALLVREAMFDMYVSSVATVWS